MSGCGSGLIDIMFVVDGSANWPIWDFADLKDWVPRVLYPLRRVINYGALWMSLAVLGGRETRCDKIYTTPNFKVRIGNYSYVSCSLSEEILQMEMKFQYRTLEGIRRGMRNVQQIGGCTHVGHGLTAALEYIEASRRPFVTCVLVLVLGGGSHDSASAVLKRINGLGRNARIYILRFFSLCCIVYFTVDAFSSCRLQCDYIRQLSFFCQNLSFLRSHRPSDERLEALHIFL